MALIQFHQHAQITGTDVRTEQLDGKEWLVAPAVVIVAGVLNGLLVPADEIDISTPSWNGRSIPVHHPNTNTANEPMTIQNQVIGYFYQAAFDTDRLKGEMWFDVAKANVLGGDAATVVETIQNGGMIEVSTAYWAYTMSQAGEFNGVPYTGITTHILPDHIAVLPGDEGACNINDGCGVPRMNQRSESMDKMVFTNCKGETFELDLLPLDEKRNCNFHLSKNVAGVSHRETNRALKTAVNFVTDIAGDFWVWVEDVWDDTFVYEIEANGSDAAGFWQRPYTIDGNLNVTMGTATRVQPRRIFEPVQEPTMPAMQNQSVFNQVKNYVQNLFVNHEKERNMDKMIAAIVENGKAGLTAEQLKELPETAVTAMFNGLKLNEAEPATEPAVAPTEPAQPEGEQVPAWAAALVAKVDGLAGKVDGLSATQNAATEQQKAGLIGKLVANERVTFSEDELKAFTLPQLEKLAASFIEPDYTGLFFGQNESSDGYDYAGLTINTKKEDTE